nr:MAG TPA: hypothetical protein [Caudoviricetes sp.]
MPTLPSSLSRLSKEPPVCWLAPFKLAISFLQSYS